MPKLVFAPALAVILLGLPSELPLSRLFGQSAPPAGQQPTSQPTQTVPQTQPAAPRNQIELVRSPLPALDSDTLSDEARYLLGFINLCDPTFCIGEPPRLVFENGRWKLHFPESYKKPEGYAKPDQPKTKPEFSDSKPTQPETK